MQRQSLQFCFSREACALALGIALALSAETVAAKASGVRVAVATEHELETRTAIAILGRGGNAIDAAVAAALVAGVVSPSSSGLGGGGFALVWLAHERVARFLDFRERAPASFDPSEWNQDPLKDEQRGRMVGVPGEPMGLFELQRQYGRLPFDDVTEDAAKLGRHGFRVGMHLAKMARAAHASSAKLAVLSALGFERKGFGVGSWVRPPRLGATLERYGRLGPKGLLEGDIASDWVRVVGEHGGVLGLADLRDYRPKQREPIRVRYGQFDVITAPPPSAGGVLLAQTLGTFRPEDLSAHRSLDERIHLLAEAYRSSFADRHAAIGDPDFVTVDVAKLLEPERLAARRRSIGLTETRHTVVALPGDRGTSHLSVVDGEGNAVALTTTVNNAFGAKLLAPESGVILNDELADFGPMSSPNRPRPLARPVSSMTPTIVLDGQEVRWALGGSGGMTISTNVTTVLLSMLVDGTSPERAVERPRFFVDPNTSELELEEQFPQSVVKGLIARGELVRTVPRGYSGVQVVARNGDSYRAVADSRKHGRGEVRVVH